MTFFMSMNPPTATHQEKKVVIRGGKPVFYEPAELKAARAMLTAHLAGHAPGKPIKGAVRLVVKWLFPKGRHADGEWRSTKPDTDNLQKLLKDCMTKVGFWKDDAQVASEICEKFWAEHPGIYVEVVGI
jgi:Holliday junction resolvase RusA-like endonuclease